MNRKIINLIFKTAVFVLIVLTFFAIQSFSNKANAQCLGGTAICGPYLHNPEFCLCGDPYCSCTCPGPLGSNNSCGTFGSEQTCNSPCSAWDCSLFNECDWSDAGQACFECNGSGFCISKPAPCNDSLNECV